MIAEYFASNKKKSQFRRVIRVYALAVHNYYFIPCFSIIMARNASVVPAIISVFLSINP